MADLVNEFSWSPTRAGKLEECARLYFWSYYGSWKGWESDAPAEVREAYRLKKLTNRWGWSGDIVHQGIKMAAKSYRAKRDFDPSGIVEWARITMRGELAYSRTTKRTRKNPREFWGLLEHEYDEDIPPEEWAGLWDRTEANLRAFFASHWPTTLRELAPEDWLDVDVGKEDFPSFDLDGVKVYSSPDLVVRMRGAVTVVDWKTGKPKDEHRDQVALYGLGVQAKHGFRPDFGILVYLAQGDEPSISITQESLAAFRMKLQLGIAEGRSYLAAPPNDPLPIDCFPMTDELRKCERCAFRRLCKRGGEA